jgi:hypothetical protein
MSFFSESPDASSPPYVEDVRDREDDMPTPFVKFSPLNRDECIKKIAIEIWESVCTHSCEKLSYKSGANRNYRGSGTCRINMTESSNLASNWNYFKELMQGFQCNIGNKFDRRFDRSYERTVTFVEFRFLSEEEYPGPPTNEIALYYWNIIDGYRKTFDRKKVRELCTGEREEIVESIKRVLATSAKHEGTESLILLTSEQIATLPQEQNWVISSEERNVYGCKAIRKLDPATFQRYKLRFEKLQKEHLQDIGNPAVPVGSWYVVDWKDREVNNASCCTIC